MPSVTGWKGRLGEGLEGAGDARFEARNAFGFRNRANQRLRSRCAITWRSRREAHPC
ncbi:transposase [Streptomyces turgidiscabies Car8]|uniref:Transposase n=1 Tax=Streptomyces turgidiscabies (strain Car8) TaxID=698760 RepID=L7F4M3_STRT8|nr:transposase [Streptomyces turgidiscabies Car8]